MKISVIIPLYNTAKYIERCLSSIASQSVQDYEIVLVNDCSTDSSLEIVTRLAESDSRIRIYSNDHNMGTMYTRSVGYSNAKGDYLIFCDSDDTMPNNAFEILLNAIESSHAEIASGCIMYNSFNNNEHIFSNALNYGDTPDSVFKSLLLMEFSNSLCAKIYKRSLFDNHSYNIIENQCFGEDVIMLFQIVNNTSKIVLSNQVVYTYYQNEGSANNKQLAEYHITNKLEYLKYIIYLMSDRSVELQDLAQRFAIHDIYSVIRPNNKKVFKKVCHNYGFDKYFTFSEIHNYFNMPKAILYYTCLKFPILRTIVRNIKS